MSSRQQPHRFHHSIEAGVHIIELSLPIQMDAVDFDKLNEAIADMVAPATASEQWVIDLHHVDYVGSALLGLLVNLRQRIKSGGGKLVLCGLNEHVSKALKTCSLHNLFAIADKRDAAVRRAISP